MESRAAKRYEKRRQYQRAYYLKYKKLKQKPSKEKQREIDAQRAIDRANCQRKWYQKNREWILKKRKKKKKRPEPPPETDSEDEHNKEDAMIKEQIEASKKLLHFNKQLKDKDKDIIRKLKKLIKKLKKQLDELAYAFINTYYLVPQCNSCRTTSVRVCWPSLVQLGWWMPISYIPMDIQHYLNTFSYNILGVPLHHHFNDINLPSVSHHC